MDDTLRRRVIRLAKERPDLRAELLPLVKKGAGYGVWPKIYGHYDGHDSIWIWTSFAGFGRMHHITGDLKMVENRLLKVREEAQKALTQMGYWADGWDIHYEPRKSQPREMVGSFKIRVKESSIGASILVEDMPSKRLGLDGWKPLPT